MPPRFKHILIPLDLSEQSLEALETAVEMARQGGARLTMLHVIETIEQADDEEIQSFYATLQERARQRLDELARRFAADELTLDGEIIYGRRGPQIVQYSLDHEIDLVVLKSPKIDLAQPDAEVSRLSYQLSVLCQCPVLLVK